MDTVFEFLLENINLLFAGVALFLAVLLSKEIKDRTRIYFYIIIGVSIFLSISVHMEAKLSGIGYSTSEAVSKYNKYGGDNMRKTLSFINYCLRPTLVLLFIQLAAKSKWNWILVGLVALTVPIYVQTYFNNLTFVIYENSWKAGKVLFFRYYSPLLCFVLLIYAAVVLTIKYYRSGTRNILLAGIIFFFTIFSSVAEMYYDTENLSTTIVLACLIYFLFIYIGAVERNRNDMIRTNNTDILTGLGNERAYYEYLIKIEKKQVELNKYAVVVMDLNGLKHTDDTLGHRYGCQLIIEFGHQLPSIFEHSRLFHTGGDEFVAICANEDYENLPTLLNKFEERFAYQEIIFEEQTLVLSVAIGSAKHLSNTSYNEVFQRADENMYKNKEKIKEKYNIVSR
jgi:diguanylate cyclase (GGDEF)-like protein